MTLISVDELADRLEGAAADGPIAVCDVRFYLADHDQGRREYAAGHLPGAVFVDLHRDLAAEPGASGRHPLPTVEHFAALLGGLGITPATRVVAYDSAGGGVAARLWWMLRSIGHSRASVLDGGIQAWTASGRALSTEVPAVAPTHYPVPPGWTGIADADTVAAAAEAGGVVVDARTGERFRGEHEPIDPRPGHVPGARNLFHGDALGPDGAHLPLGELAQRFGDVGPSPIVYCGSGVTACHGILAMSLVGITARLYPGSWSEWSADPTRPVAVGE
jgi:thiosulfate/3-mercaptopyruvate sulfurtransferase